MGRKEDWFRSRPSFGLLNNKKDLVGAEVGVGGGGNATDILEHLDIKRLYLIDQYLPYRGLFYSGVWKDKEEAQKIKDDAFEHMLPYKDKIIWIYELSENAVDKIPEQLDFVYIDANHRYEYVKKDIELYLHKIKRDGLICGHDFNHEKGVTRAVREAFTSFSFARWDWWKKIEEI